MSERHLLARRRFLQLTAAGLTSACGGSGGEAPAGATPAPVGMAAEGPGQRAPAALADLIVAGGAIWTGDPSRPECEALAVSAGRIVATGDMADIGTMRGPKTEVIDLAGGLAVPGLQDAHGHVSSQGRGLEEVDLRGATSIAEVVERLRAKAGPEGWITGRGWDQNLWSGAAMPTAEELSAAFPDRPVWLRRVDGHAGWGNRKLLEVAGIGKGTKAPPGGEILRDAAGAPSGVLVDAAMGLVTPPPPTRADLERWILAAQDHLARRGLTGVHDMGVDPETDAVYRELVSRGPEKGLALRIAGYSTGEWFRKELLPGRKPDTLDADARYGLVGVKLYADGALGSRGAYLLAPYSDRPGHRGLMQHSREELTELATEAMRTGWQVATHAIGDGGNRVVLDAYAAALQRHRNRDHRFRVEHAQIVDPADISRFVSDAVIASMQPTHATSDMPWVPARIGPERVTGAYAWQRFLAAGAHLCFGSDFPVELADVTHGLYAAITRQNGEGQPDGGWLPDQRLTLEQALRAFGAEAAYAVRCESYLGRLAKGFAADITCFRGDLRKLPPLELREAGIAATIVGGRVVYRA